MAFVTLLICGVGSVWPVRGFDGRGGWIPVGFVAEREGYADSPSTSCRKLGAIIVRDNVHIPCWGYAA
jgi:hypothetical protein